ncbi:sensor histidine kinase [Alteromonas sp. ASW11-130]|uniref:sensor histidine kinase n=1 Tax=Alteromonas sp. ASW11-130 TaxID=3015775 RepID=UPI00224295F3|nr:HAMP domain-containing histidine kinase [Alteromonas sp. ASW11-130]
MNQRYFTDKFSSISTQVISRFCLYTFILSAVYSLLSLLLMYDLEDKFIEKQMAQEAKYLSQQYRSSGEWLTPRREHMSLHFSKRSLPKDIRVMAIQEPQRKEFSGSQGRHYHLYPLPEQPNVFLLSEVSSELMVRPVRNDVIKFFVISAVIVTLIACIIAWFIGRKTTKPLKQLASAVEGMQPGQMRKGFAQQFPPNEIKTLAITLEHTMIAFNDALQREKCFTRDVSHELRTPLAIIKNALEVHNATTSSEQADIKRIAQACVQMENTVSTLLMLAREEHNVSQKEAIQLMPVVEQSVLDHLYLLNNKSVEVNVDDSCHATILAQPGMLNVLLANLLSNAFQYTDKGEVTIRYVDNTLMVSDTGTGIESSIGNRFLEPGVQGSKSTGYGFGMSIVKRLCDYQNWTLGVNSEQGTEISVLINA